MANDDDETNDGREMEAGGSTPDENALINAELAKAKRNKKKPKKKPMRRVKWRVIDSVTKKFLRNFDPEHSEREKRKLFRRLYHCKRSHGNSFLYDEKGIFMQTGNDLCDCLSLECAGCHFPCSKCSSTKCGHECRNNRRWIYDTIHCEGTDPMIKNPLLIDDF